MEALMKVSHAVTLVGLGIGAVGMVASQGCSSPSSPAAGDGGTAGTSIEPPTPTGGATTVTAEHNYALSKLYLGDTDRAGVSSQTAWKAYGFDIDHKISTKDSTDVCSLASGASKSTQTDGNGGIDNSFGENILPIVLTTAGQDAASKINDSIQQGTFTIMIDVTGLDATDKTQTATGLSGFLNAGGKFDPMKAPTFTTADDWPVRPELLSNASDPKSSTVRFPSAYVVNGTFVNGSPGKLTLNLAIGGVALDLTISQAVITFNNLGNGKTNNGTIAGVINTEDLITKLKAVAGRISTSLCQGSAFESIAQQIRQASDIKADGTNAAGAPCDGISIGLGFDAAEIGLPKTVGMLAAPSPDPCAASDGGTGDAASD
jgi:hypothetical protein